MMLGKNDQGLAFNKLHGQEKFASLGNPTIDQLGDVRVIQRGEDLALAAKMPLQFLIGETWPNDLQSNLLLEFAVGAGGQENRAHSATSNLSQDAVGAEASAEILVVVIVQVRCEGIGVLLKHVLRFLVGG